MTLYALLQGNIHKKIQCKSEYYFGWEKKSVITKIIKIIVIAHGGGGICIPMPCPRISAMISNPETNCMIIFF